MERLIRIKVCLLHRGLAYFLLSIRHFKEQCPTRWVISFKIVVINVEQISLPRACHFLKCFRCKKWRTFLASVDPENQAQNPRRRANLLWLCATGNTKSERWNIDQISSLHSFLPSAVEELPEGILGRRSQPLCYQRGHRNFQCRHLIPDKGKRAICGAPPAKPLILHLLDPGRHLRLHHHHECMFLTRNRVYILLQSS